MSAARKPTEQQQAAIDALKNPEIKMLKVEAAAGSGKTSSLIMMSDEVQVPSLYLAFNKAIADEAAEKFSKHVTCKTTHSMAYAAFGAKLRDKLSRPTGRYVNVAGTGSEIAKFFKLSNLKVNQDLTISANFLGLMAKETVARFEQSADDTLEFKHTPKGLIADRAPEESVGYIRGEVLAVAKKLWAERINLKSQVLATHDTYLKLYQLSKPVFGGVEVLYVDEAQDTTPCVLDIVMNQADHMKVVFVGDRRQSIYQFRGAVNAMQTIEAETRYLTKSWRFGQVIADVATAVLENDMVITGNEKIESKVGFEGVVDRSKPYACLFRTNAALLTSAIEEIASGTEVAIEVDTKDFVKLMESALALFNGDMKNVKHDTFLPYMEWSEAVEESENDPGMARVIKIVEENKAEHYIAVLKAHKNAKTPHVTFTTAHKSKGLQYPQVILGNDFKSPYDKKTGKWVGLSEEEINLLYVALTRAEYVLEYNKTVAAYIARGKDQAIYNRFDALRQEVGLEPVFNRYIGRQVAELKKDMQF
jgi:hypothetical protein